VARYSGTKLKNLFRMKPNLSRLMVVLGLANSLVGRAFAADNEPPTLFVAPFGADRLDYWQPAMGEGLSEMLITELGRMNKFQMLETSQLNALKDEIQMGNDGWVEPSAKVEKGGFAAADFMFTAKVTRFGSKEKNIGLGGFVQGGLGGLGVKQTTADVRIDWRLVDASSRKIIKTGSALSEQKGGGFVLGANVSGSGGGIGFDNSEFISSALGRATVAALSQITNELGTLSVPEPSRRKQKAMQAQRDATAAKDATEALRHTVGKVLAVPGKDSVIVSLGTKHGFKSGDKLALYQTTDVKDDQGAVVFSDEKLVGEVTLENVQEERSKASYAGELDVKAGWNVKAK
jgi:curli biogenesis system outer membrane secretion channel CsgG